MKHAMTFGQTALNIGVPSAVLYVVISFCSREWFARLSTQKRKSFWKWRALIS